MPGKKLVIRLNREEKMGDTSSFLAARLHAEGEKTTAFFRSLSAPQNELTVYEDQAVWNVRHILAHLVATEEMVCAQIESVLSGGKGIDENFDIDSFNQVSVSKRIDTSAADLLQQFFDYRQKTINLVETLTADDLAQYGRHPYLGWVPLVEVIKLIYRHNQIHQRDIRKVLSGS